MIRLKKFVSLGERVQEKKTSKLHFKVAGGAAAQTLALINALFVQEKTGKTFEISYYPEATGTYWPFEIEFLLNPNEIRNKNASIKGLSNLHDRQIGKIVTDHPLQTKIFSYEKFLMLIRQIHMEFPLRYLIQREIALEAKHSRLGMSKNWIKSYSGGYVPLFSKSIFHEIDRRFKRKFRDSPFSFSAATEPYTAIHYRIGDKRTNFSTNFRDYDGVFDPLKFLSILQDSPNANRMPVYVVSDEPLVAQQLLAEVGIKAKIFPQPSDIWIDLYRLSQAKIFIGSWSQVSQLAACCVSNNGGRSYLPGYTSQGKKVQWHLPEITWFAPRFLPRDHEIYKH